MKKTSAMLSGKCEKTQENLKKLMADAGCADGEVVKVSLPLAPGSRDDVVFAGLNGVSFYFHARDGLRDARGGGGDSEELRGDVIS